jgi:acyl carrier protein
VSTTTVAPLDRINAIVSQFVVNAPELARHQDLEELGLTSMQMVNLMLSIEAEFDLTIPSSKLVPSNFRTIANIEALIWEIGH